MLGIKDVLEKGGLDLLRSGLDITGATDSTAAVSLALTVGDIDIGRYELAVTDLTIPDGRKISGRGGTIKPSGTVLLGNDVEIDNVVFDLSAGGRIAGYDLRKIRLNRFVTKDSSFYGVLFDRCKDIRAKDSEAYDSAGHGFYFQDCDDVDMDGTISEANAYAGIFVTSSDPEYKCTGIKIRNSDTNSNGTEGLGHSGITIACATNVHLSANNSYENIEHGISIQEIEDFSITGSNHCYLNGGSGICSQSGQDGVLASTRDGVIDGNLLYGNTDGMTFKEVNENIMVGNNRVYDNTGYQIRFVDVASSGLISSSVSLKGNMTITTKGANIVNSNGSKFLVLDNINNVTKTAYHPSLTVFETVESATTLPTAGVDKGYPEVLFVDDSTYTISYTRISEAVEGRRLTIISLASDLRIRHLVGIEQLNGQFLLSSEGLTSLDVGGSISFIADGLGRWVETSRNLLVA